MDEQINLEIAEEEKVDLTDYLRTIGDDLLEISKSCDDQDQRTEFFRGIKEELETVMSELQEDMEIFHEEMPEKVAEICRDMDKNLHECQKLYESAIGKMLDFIGTGNAQLIADSKKILDEAAERIRKDDLMNEQLNKMINLN